jgi:hypothetical protein
MGILFDKLLPLSQILINCTPSYLKKLFFVKDTKFYNIYNIIKCFCSIIIVSTLSM